MEVEAEEAFVEPVGDVSLFKLIGAEPEYSASSLSELSGDKRPANPDFRSGLTLRIAAAWITPLSDLTCGQIRMLVGQKLGLPWLSAPVVMFLRESPGATCDLYPGDLMWAALSAHEQLLRFAPVETRALLESDFDWMDAEFQQYGDPMWSEAIANLAAARRSVGLS